MPITQSLSTSSLRGMSQFNVKASIKKPTTWTSWEQASTYTAYSNYVPLYADSDTLYCSPTINGGSDYVERCTPGTSTDYPFIRLPYTPGLYNGSFLFAVKNNVLVWASQSGKYSLDKGNTWSVVNGIGPSSYGPVTYSNGMFCGWNVNQGNGLKFVWSTDGIYWASADYTVPSNNGLGGLTYFDGSKFNVYLGNSKYQSLDGRTFTQSSIGGWINGFAEIASNGSGTLVYPYRGNNSISYSLNNGATWSSVSLSVYPYAIVYGNGIFVGVCDGTYPSTNRKFIWSTNGVTWNTVDNAMPVSKLWYNLVYLSSLGKFVAIAPDGTMAISTI